MEKRIREEEEKEEGGCHMVGNNILNAGKCIDPYNCFGSFDQISL